jgi:hypothetical protein
MIKGVKRVLKEISKVEVVVDNNKILMIYFKDFSVVDLVDLVVVLVVDLILILEINKVDLIILDNNNNNNNNNRNHYSKAQMLLRLI